MNMPSDCISYKESGYFTNLILDYLDQKDELRELYIRFPSLENFEGQINEKQQNFSGDRDLLADVIEAQYKGLNMSELTSDNIQLLRQTSTFTVTTGHQLNLFTGPMYFLYKIVSAVNLAKKLKVAYPAQNFVPVYWMATEDHDFDEINYFNFKGKKFRWNRESSGAVGRLSTDGLDSFYKVFSGVMGDGKHADELRKLFSDAYLNHDNLADATRYLANELFGEIGLVIIDADNRDLKRQFAPHIKEELTNQLSHIKVEQTSPLLKSYSLQVNPREINLFYLDEEIRERIIFENDMYRINNTTLQFSRDELLKLLETNPEKFSPNVIMRPLYQEVILPNLCYIGGGGEIAYWLQLKNYFNASNITFPMLLLRNSALIATQKQAEKLSKLDLDWQHLFSKPNALAMTLVAKLSDKPLHFDDLKETLRLQFEKLEQIASHTDKSFIGAVKAQERKQIKGLENLEQRLRRAEKRKHAEEIQRAADLQDELFPHHSLQERFANFSEYYLEYGSALIPRLTSELDPLNFSFRILTF